MGVSLSCIYALINDKILRMIDSNLGKKIGSAIRTVKDFPNPGINYKDITPLLANAELFHALMQQLADYYRQEKFNAIACIESRGFIFGSALAYLLGVGIIPIRKKGKLPFATHAIHYNLEYGDDALEIHVDALQHLPAAKVLVVDDVLATGGTAKASAELLKRAGAQSLHFCFLLTLQALKGKDQLQDLGIIDSVLVDNI